jgi:glycosyltransferase involved in cell wall biosynthesis
VKILVVGMADSVHLARWLGQFTESEFTFELVSSSPHRNIHYAIRDRVDGKGDIRMHWVSRYFSLPLWLLDRVLSDWMRGILIAWRIKRFQPQILHINELQNAGYASRRALQLLGRKRPKVIVTNYGSELVWFSKYPNHRKKLIWLIKNADAFSAECERDYKIAKSFDSTVYALPKIPVSGGLEPFSGVEQKRYAISIKGYENKWGKASFVLDTLLTLEKHLPGIQLFVFSCNRSILRRVKKLRQTTNLEIVAYPKGRLRHTELLKLLQISKIYIGHSLSDGISTSMMEAMGMGAIPIQTSTSCADEWIDHGKTGFLFEPFDGDALKNAITQIISKNFNEAEARKKNYLMLSQKCDPEEIAKIAKSYYLYFA